MYVIKLFISYVKLYKLIFNFIVGKWVKSVFKDLGIDIGIFFGNSVRLVFILYGVQVGLIFVEIFKVGGWINV